MDSLENYFGSVGHQDYDNNSKFQTQLIEVKKLVLLFRHKLHI